MRKALCVGIDYYQYANCLDKCVSDAESMVKALSRHGDGRKNFQVLPIYASKKIIKEPVSIDLRTNEVNYERKIIGDPLTVEELRFAVKELFDTDAEVVLFYYSGHGHVDANGGYLCTSDVDRYNKGYPLNELMEEAGKSRAQNKVIILDSCFSGQIGKIDKMSNYCVLPENTTLLASCTAESTAVDGCFTPLMVQALMGGAMNLLGDVSPGSIYSYIDNALSAWDQRPVFKANVKSFISLRKNEALIDLRDLHQLTDHFPSAEYLYPLDPTYESSKLETDNKEVNKDHEAIMALFRNYLKFGLLVPVDEKYLYYAALNSKSAKLTPLGQYYWRLVDDDII